MSQEAAAHDDLLTRMVHERENLARERAKLDRRIRGLDVAIADYRSTASLEVPSLPRAGRRLRNILSLPEVADHARRLILAEGRPLTRTELLTAFDRDRLPILAKNRGKALGTMLWRSRRADGTAAFLSTDSGYWPSDVDLPDAG